MHVEDIAMRISQQNLEKQPILIGIEGFGGSGKSTTSLKLTELLRDAAVVRVDDFIIKEYLSTGDWDLLVFDRKRLESEVLAPASRSLAVTYQKLLWDTNTLSEPVSIGIPNYLIIEGIACYHPSIAHYYDYKIWVDTPIDIANKRGRARDAGNENEKYWDLWSKNDLAYKAKYRPEVVADFVVNNFNTRVVVCRRDCCNLTDAPSDFSASEYSRSSRYSPFGNPNSLRSSRNCSHCHSRSRCFADGSSLLPSMTALAA